MAYIVSGQEKAIFQRVSYGELVAFLSESDVKKKLLQILNTIEKRKKMYPQDSFWEHGRDIFLTNIDMRRWICSRSVSSVAQEFAYCTDLRLGFDQFISTSQMDNFVFTLSKVCVEPLILGGMICLSQDAVLLQEVRDSSARNKDGVFFSSSMMVGSIVFFSSTTEIVFEKEKQGSFFMFGFGRGSMLYVEKKDDPAFFSLKRHAYMVSQELSLATHPRVCIW